MKRLFCLILALCLLSLSACGTKTPAPTESTAPSSSSTEATTEPTTETTTEATTESTTEPAPQAAYELGLCAASSYRDDSGTIWAMGLAEIVNTGEKPLFLDYGSFDVTDGSGRAILSVSSVAAYPQVILPGERGYYFEVFEPGLPDTQALSLIVTPDIREATVDAVRYEVTQTQLRNSPYGGLELTGLVKNTTERKGELVCVAAILLDKDGAPLGIVTTILTEALNADAQTDFAADSFMLPPEIKADQVKELVIYAYPLQEQP